MKETVTARRIRDLAVNLGFDVRDAESFDEDSTLFYVYKPNSQVRVLYVVCLGDKHTRKGRAVTIIHLPGQKNTTFAKAAKVLGDMSFSDQCEQCHEGFKSYAASNDHYMGRTCAGCAARIPACMVNNLCVFCEGHVAKGEILPLGERHTTGRFYQQTDISSAGAVYQTWYRHSHGQALFFMHAQSDVAGRTFKSVTVLRHIGQADDTMSIADSNRWVEVHHLNNYSKAA